MADRITYADALVVLLRSVGLICRGHRAVALENRALRQQVAALTSRDDIPGSFTDPRDGCATMPRGALPNKQPRGRGSPPESDLRPEARIQASGPPVAAA